MTLFENSVAIDFKSLSNWHNAFRLAENFIKQTVWREYNEHNQLRESAWQIIHEIPNKRCSLYQCRQPMHLDWKLHIHQPASRKLISCFFVSSDSSASTVWCSMCYSPNLIWGMNLSSHKEYELTCSSLTCMAAKHCSTEIVLEQPRLF